MRNTKIDKLIIDSIKCKKLDEIVIKLFNIQINCKNKKISNRIK